MLVKFLPKLGVLAASVFLCLVLCVQAQEKKKDWIDRPEYDLYESITKEQNPTKRLELLNTWKTKYANTNFKVEQLALFLTTYQQLNQAGKMVETAKEILTISPNDFTAAYWISFLSPTLGDTSPGALDAAAKSAQTMLSNLDATFAADKKPAATAEADWKKAKDSMQAVALKTQGWVAWSGKKFEEAEAPFVGALKVNPNDSVVSYWLGNCVYAQKKIERYPLGLFHLARAASYDGAGALAPAGRTEVDNFLKKAYVNYHGDESGLAELKALAKTTALPPDGFKIKSKLEIAEEKLAEEKKFAEGNPELALWIRLRDELKGANGDAYFESSMKDAELPKLKGKLVSHDPAVRPKKLVLAMSDATTPEVTITLSAPMVGKADPGTEIEFVGTPKSYSKDPLMVQFEVEKEKVKGWPAQAAPAPARPAARPGARKGGAKK